MEKMKGKLQKILGSNNSPFILHPIYHSRTIKTDKILDVSKNVLKMNFSQL